MIRNDPKQCRVSRRTFASPTCVRVSGDGPPRPQVLSVGAYTADWIEDRFDDRPAPSNCPTDGTTGTGPTGSGTAP